jgi:uncharacterized phage-associated protein
MLACQNVADYFIWLANSTGSFISNLKLQKLVYYAQAWHLALNGMPLFDEDFEAWVHGPVIPTLYHEFKEFSWKPIFKEVDEQHLLDSLGDEAFGFLQEVAEEYFCCDAYELERMTHAEAPWLRARGSLPLDAPSNEVIHKEWMKEYYGARAQQEN